MSDAPPQKRPTDRRRLVADIFSVAFVLLFAASLAAHALEGFHMRYMADDYCTAGAVRTLGFVGAQKHFYFGWSGRFSFTAVVSLFALAGPWVVPFLPAAAVALWTCALAWAVYQFRNAAGWPRPLLTSLLLAELIAFATLNDTPSVFESVYWQTGMLTYLLPLVLLTFYVGWVKRLAERGGGHRPTPAALVSSAALAFFAAGFNETYAAFQTAALLTACAACLSAGGRAALRKTVLPLACAGLAGSLVAAAVVLLAPGNEVRLAALAGVRPRLDLLDVARVSLESAFRFVTAEHKYSPTPLLTTASLLLPALLALNLPARSDETAHDADNFTLRALLISPVVVFALVLSCFVPAVYAASVSPPYRAQVNAQFVLTVFHVFWGYLAGSALRRVISQGDRRRPQLFDYLSIAAAALLTLSPVAATRSTLAGVPKSKALAALWDRQDEEIRAARSRGATELTVPVVHYLEGTDLLRRDPTWYVNVCAASFYGLDSITAVPSAEGTRIMNEEPAR